MDLRRGRSAASCYFNDERNEKFKQQDQLGLAQVRSSFCGRGRLQRHGDGVRGDGVRGDGVRGDGVHDGGAHVFQRESRLDSSYRAPFPRDGDPFYCELQCK